MPMEPDRTDMTRPGVVNAMNKSENSKRSPGNNSDIQRWQKDGAESAAAAIFQTYAGRLHKLAARQLYTWLQERTSPDSIVMSVLASVLRDLAAGKVQPLPDGDPLWPLLAQKTRQKVLQRAEYWSRQKRSPKNQRETVDAAIADTQPGPEDVAELNDLLERARQQMDSLQWEVFSLRYLSGCSLAECARQLERAEGTVRTCWKSIIGIFKRLT